MVDIRQNLNALLLANQTGSKDIGTDEEVEEENGEDGVERERECRRAVADVDGEAEEFVLETLVVDVEAGKHLRDLKGGDRDGHTLRDVDMQGLECVVGVHQRVDSKVHGDHPTSGAGHVNEREPRKAQSKNMMNPVKLNQLRLAQHDEQRVDQLDRLRERKEEVPDRDAIVLLGGGGN